MAHIGLVSCVSRKREYGTKAEDMYMGPLFTKSLKYAKHILKADRIYILSAKYGLLALHDEIQPYNVSLNGVKKGEKQAWALQTMQQIKGKCDPANDIFHFLAGKNYYKYLLPYLVHYEIIMEGLKIGERLQWLGVQLSKGGIES